MAIRKLKGQNFRAFLGEGSSDMAPFPEEYTEEQMASKQWSAQVDHVDASTESLRALITMFNSDDKPFVGWDETTKDAGGQNRTPAGSTIARSGRAIINDISIVANNRQTIQTTVQLQGSGALS